MPDSARLFVYTSNVELSESVAASFSEQLDVFMVGWRAHGSELTASFSIIANRVLLIALDEADQNATGCSIDSLNRHLRAGQLDWFSRNWVLYRESASKHLDCSWTTISLNDFWGLCRTGKIDIDSEVINTTVLTLGEARKNLIQKISDSWHINLI
jgi:hypothetical protein